MSMRKSVIIALLILAVIALGATALHVAPTISELAADLQTYETHVAMRDDYRLHTTPLPKSVVEDICDKLGIRSTSRDCLPGAVVYAPDLFDEIQAYFYGLPLQDRTSQLVKDKLGGYLIDCEEPNPAGHYRCSYDLRGDQRYPVFFYFDKEGIYYRIIANTGGS